MFSYEWQTCPIRNLGSKNPNPRLVSSNPRLMTSNPRLVKCNPRPRRQSPSAETPPRKLRLRPISRCARGSLRSGGLSLNFLGGVSASGDCLLGLGLHFTSLRLEVISLELEFTSLG